MKRNAIMQTMGSGARKERNCSRATPTKSEAKMTARMIQSFPLTMMS